MFFRDWRAYKTTREVPLLAHFVPHWIPAFPFTLAGAEDNDKLGPRRKISDITVLSFLSK